MIPKKRTVALCFLEFFLPATPPPSPLLPISLLHRIRRCGWAAASPDRVPGCAFLFSLLSYLIDGCPDIKGTMKQMKRICCLVVGFIADCVRFRTQLE